MHIPGFLIFLAIVVYWASCMGRQALKWVAILFVSACLLPVAVFLVLWAVETYRANHPTSAEADYAFLKQRYEAGLDRGRHDGKYLACILFGDARPMRVELRESCRQAVLEIQAASARRVPERAERPPRP